MYSLSQVVLGASIAGACAPRGQRRKALLAGAALGTLHLRRERRRLEALETVAKQPLIEAWAAFLRRDLAAAKALSAEAQDAGIAQPQGCSAISIRMQMGMKGARLLRKNQSSGLIS